MAKAKYIADNNPQVTGFEIGKIYSFRDFGRGIQVFYDEDEGCSLVMGYNLFYECFTLIETTIQSDNDELICPYCGHHYRIDYTEDFGNYGIEFDDVEFDCPKCGETYLVSQRVQFTYETYKKGETK